jgi:hypothetical protein
MKKPRKETGEPVSWSVHIMRAKLTWARLCRSAKAEADILRDAKMLEGAKGNDSHEGHNPSQIREGG